MSVEPRNSCTCCHDAAHRSALHKGGSRVGGWLRNASVLVVVLVACKSRVAEEPVAPVVVQQGPLLERALVTSGNAAIDSVWNDPVFQRQFVAGYGINAEVEPRLIQEEILVLEKVRPLMGVDLVAAEAMLRSLMKPNCSATLDFTLGSLLFQQDRRADALQCFEMAVTKFPSFRRAWRNLGLLHVRDARHADAIRCFTRFVELGGGDGYAYGLLGYAHAAREDWQPAEASYRNALLLQPENTEWRLGLARCVFKEEKYEDAATLLDALIARTPDKAEFWMLQAQTYLGMKQPLRAAENLEILDGLGRASSENLYTLGDIYGSENLPDLSARAYVRAIKADPAQPLARPLRCVEQLLGKGAVEPARGVVTEVRGLWWADMADAERSRLLKLEARLSMAEGGGSAETAAVLEKILKLDPLDGEALMLLAQHHSRNNEKEKAIFFYERAEGIEVHEAEARVRHAQILVGLGRHGDAVPLLRRAQEMKPREAVARYLEQVERLARSRK